MIPYPKSGLTSGVPPPPNWRQPLSTHPIALSKLDGADAGPAAGPVSGFDTPFATRSNSAATDSAGGVRHANAFVVARTGTANPARMTASARIGLRSS
ncbi:MAG: hypothetical protein ACRDFX_06145 [Chloroflexota bacterium]